MKHLKRYKYHVVAAAILIAVLMAGVKTKVSEVTEAPKDLPKIEVQGQLEHALELFPRARQADLLSVAPEADQRPLILGIVKKSLPAAYREQAFEITRAVITEANHHQMDPLFLLAVIATESSFNPKARGGHGEQGLMQILPKTAQWLAPQAGLKPEALNLEDAATNIRLGATYIAQLRHSFARHGSRYVSAYNMGSANVRRLVKENREPMIYSNKVIKNYQSLYGKLEKAQASRSVASAQ